MQDFLHEYLEAERIGQSYNMSCAKEFPECPVSLYNLFRLSGGTDNPEEIEDPEVSSEQSGRPILGNDLKHIFGSDAQLMDKRLYQTDNPLTYLNS